MRLSRRWTTGRKRSWGPGGADLAGPQRRRSSRELELEAENEELKAALGEPYVKLRVWNKGVSPSLETSR